MTFNFEDPTGPVEEFALGYEQGVELLDSIDWAEWLSKVDDNAKCSPTLSFIREKNKHLVWCSVVESECFYVGYIFDGDRNGVYADGLEWECAKEILTGYLEGKYEEVKAGIDEAAKNEGNRIQQKPRAAANSWFARIFGL